MITFKILLLSHLLGDFPLQTNRIVHMKLTGHKGLLLHVAIHLFVSAVLIQHVWQYGGLLLFLGVTHYLIDWTKIRLQPADSPQLKGFVIDQIIHLLTLGLIAQWVSELHSILPVPFLTLAITITAVPAILMAVWVWANDMRQAQNMVNCKLVVWACQRLLPISQCVGWIGVGFVLMMLFILAV